MDTDEVSRVARNARLQLTDDELKEFAKDLEDVLSYFSILDEAPDVGRHDFNPVPIKNVLREDMPARDVDSERCRDSMDTYLDMVRGPRLA